MDMKTCMLSIWVASAFPYEVNGKYTDTNVYICMYAPESSDVQYLRI